MKISTFTAQWNDYPAQPDPSMNRDRAARLIRAWRRNARKRTNNAPWHFQKVGPHAYRVSAPGYPAEFHTMTIN